MYSFNDMPYQIVRKPARCFIMVIPVTPRPNFIVNLCVQVVNYYFESLSKINIRAFNKHIIL